MGVESLLAAQRSRLVAEVDDRKLWRADGSKAFWAWLSRTCDMSPRSAKTLVHLARGLQQAPLTRAAFEAGTIDQQLFDTDWAQAKAEHGDDTRAVHLARRPAQRRADALVEMARRSATHQPSLNGDSQPRPLFSVHIGPDTVARLCELASGTVIAPGRLVPYLGEADIERIIYGPKSRVIDLSKRAPFFRGGQSTLARVPR